MQFFHTENITPIDLHQHFLDIYGNQTVDVSTLRWWVIHFSSDNNNVCDKPFH